MASKSETGHAVNAGNFSRIIMCCEELGTDFTPPESSISIVNLKAKETKINDALALYNEKAAPWMQAVNDREAIMEPVNKLLTKVKNLVNACAVTQQFKDDVKGLVKKVQGVRSTPKIVTEPSDPNAPTSESVVQISAAQTGIDNKIDNIDMLIQLLKVEAGYTPNETELKTTTLETLLTDIKAKNMGVAAKTPAMDNARVDRDKEMYTSAGSGAELSGKVKAYFKAKFGGNSKEYHNVSKYEYKKLVK